MKRNRRWVVGVAFTAAALCGAGAYAQPTMESILGRPRDIPPDPSAVLQAPRKPASMKGTFTLTSIGDLHYFHPVTQSGDAELGKVSKLLKSGDLTVGNQEGVFFDMKAFKGSGYASGMMLGEAGIAKDEKALGVNMVGLANNHGGDWGADGLLDMIKLLDAAGVVHAGGGLSREAAYAPVYYQTPKGRVGFVDVASTFTVNAIANDPTFNTPARPGIAELRTRRIALITADQMADLRAVAAKINGRAPQSGDLNFGGQIYRVADKPGTHFEMNLYDHAQILKAIRDAKQNADMAIFAIHAHESGGKGEDDPIPPDFEPTLFHNAVDAGADIVMGGGAHTLRGIEIYRGKPVFYGLAGFFLTFIRGDIRMMQDTVQADAFPRPARTPEQMAAEAAASAALVNHPNPATWYDGIVATTTMEGDRVKEVRIYPLERDRTGEGHHQGIPHFAPLAEAKRILEVLQKDSDAFGTKIEIEGAVGVIHPS